MTGTTFFRFIFVLLVFCLDKMITSFFLALLSACFGSVPKAVRCDVTLHLSSLHFLQHSFQECQYYSQCYPPQQQWRAYSHSLRLELELGKNNGHPYFVYFSLKRLLLTSDIYHLLYPYADNKKHDNNQKDRINTFAHGLIIFSWSRNFVIWLNSVNSFFILQIR